MTDEEKIEETAIHQQLWLLSSAIRDRCFSAAVQAYEDARSDGLCHDGAWECALAALRSIDFEAVVAKTTAGR